MLPAHTFRLQMMPQFLEAAQRWYVASMCCFALRMAGRMLPVAFLASSPLQTAKAFIWLGAAAPFFDMIVNDSHMCFRTRNTAQEACSHLVLGHGLNQIFPRPTYASTKKKDTPGVGFDLRTPSEL